MVLKKEHTVADLRKLMGTTNPVEAAEIIRKAFAASIDCNAIHGSVSDEIAAPEIAFFFLSRDLLIKEFSIIKFCYHKCITY